MWVKNVIIDFHKLNKSHCNLPMRPRCNSPRESTGQPAMNCWGVQCNVYHAIAHLTILTLCGEILVPTCANIWPRHMNADWEEPCLQITIHLQYSFSVNCQSQNLKCLRQSWLAWWNLIAWNIWISALLCVNSTFAWQVAFACTAQQNSQDYDLFNFILSLRVSRVSCISAWCILLMWLQIQYHPFPLLLRGILREFLKNMSKGHQCTFFQHIPNNIRYLMIPPAFSSLICIRSACTVRSSASCWNLWI